MAGPANVSLIDSSSGTPVTATGAPADWPGGQGLFTADCTTFNGATIKLQYLGPDNSTWIDGGAATTLTASGSGIFYLPPCKIRCAIITAVPSTGVSANAARIIS